MLYPIQVKLRTQLGFLHMLCCSQNEMLSKICFHIVYIHNREDRMWVSTGAPPMPMPTIQLGIHNQTDIISIKATIAEKHTTLMNKLSAHCKVYKDEKEGFNICSQMFFSKFLKEKVKCTLPGRFLIFAFLSQM